MERNSEEFKRMVYDQMTGSLDPKKCSEADEKLAVNEFAEGSVCDEAYKRVYNASEKLSERLGVPFGEDKDIECIINSMFEIQEILCMKMYEYGWYFSKNEEK